MHGEAINGILMSMQGDMYMCKNGLAAVAEQQSAFPVVSLQVWVESGSEHEGEFLGAGVSHLAEHMAFKGTEEYNSFQLNEEVASHGGLWNAYTTTDRTVFHIDGPSGCWRHFLHLLIQLVFHPTFPEEEFEKEREVIRREMAMYDDDPQDIAYRTLSETLFALHPRRFPVIGHMDRFNALTREDLVSYHRNNYVPCNVFVCMAGDVEPSLFFSALEEEVADIPARPMPYRMPASEFRQWGRRVRRREFAQPTSTLMLGWRIPSTQHPDAAAISMLSAALGEGRAAWLYKEFHDARGIAHDISASIIPSKTDEGAFVVEADVERADRDRLRDSLLEWMGKLPEADFTQATQRALRRIMVQRLRILSTVQGKARLLGSSWHVSRNLHASAEWEEALHRVTPQDIARVAALYLTPERLLEVSIDPIGSNPETATCHAPSPTAEPGLSVLPNGLRLALRVDRRAPIVDCNLCLGAGCPTETEQTAGINNLLAECMLKGTTSRSSAQLAEDIENLGGGISSHAGNNTLNISARSLAHDAPAMLELLADAALRPSFPEDAVETARNDMLADILDEEEDPVSVAIRLLRRTCYGPVSYGNHPDGSTRSVSALTRSDLIQRHASLMCARNAVLSIAGDIDVESITRLVAELFADMPQGRPAARTATPPQKAGEARKSLGKCQAVLALALPGANATSEEAPLQLLFEEWCRDMSGPLYKEIREKHGLAYYVAADSMMGVDTGYLLFFLGTSPKALPQARSLLEKTLAGLARAGMPAEALERTRATVLAARLLDCQSCSKLCAAAAVDTILGLPPYYGDRLPERLQAVTLEKMNAYIRRTLGNKVRTICEIV